MNGLPNQLYTEGAVVFNSQPATNFYLQSMAKKRAKAEALDNYFRDFGKTINPAGMRNQDIEGWMSKANDWRQFYMQYRDRIKNPRLDNGAAQSEYFGRYQDLLGDTQKSKSLGEVSKQYVVPIATNPDKKARLHDEALDAIHAHDVSMYSDEHRPLDPSVFDYDAKPFDIAAAKKLDDMATKDVKMSNVVKRIKVDPKTKTRTATYESSYSPEDLQTIGVTYADAFKSDPKGAFAQMIRDMSTDLESVEKYNDVFKKTTGHDIQSNEDLAAAYGLDRVQKQMSKQEVGTHNPYSPWDYQAARDASWENRQGMYDDSIDELVENQKQRAQSVSAAWGGNFLEIPADQATLLALKAEKIRYNPDNGTFIPVWHEKQKNSKGEEESVEVHGTPMTEMDYKAALGKRNIGKQYFQKNSTPSQSKGTSSSNKKKISGF